ncbi:hypothetical protein Tco_0939704 [Tanacetum coccineum]|uniref:Uncharacterized protein n=1 Tax=Tanacetum coccineum TaxID=301880 RepID=A0ABQ5DRZ3_9ASTR
MLAPLVVVGEGSKQPTEPQPTSSTAPQDILTQVATATASKPPKDPNTYWRTKRGRNTKVPQSGGSPKKASSGPWYQETMGVLLLRLGLKECLNSPSGSGEGRMEHQFELMSNVPITPHDSPLLGVLDLEKEKDAQAVEILRLKKRVNRLERQMKSRTSQPRRRKYGWVESSDADLDEEDASKQGRKNDKTNPMLQESDFDGFDDETVDAATTGVNTASAPVTTAGVAISTTEPRTPSTTTTVFDDEDFDEIQAIINADALFAAKLQQEEREFQLKGKTYEEIHELYERQQKRNQDFTPMDSKKEAQKSGKRLKRVAGSYATQQSHKKSKVMKSVKNVTEEEAAEYEKEKEELMLSLKIISGDDSEVNYEPLSRRFPIVN